MAGCAQAPQQGAVSSYQLMDAGTRHSHPAVLPPPPPLLPLFHPLVVFLAGKGPRLYTSSLYVSGATHPHLPFHPGLPSETPASALVPSRLWEFLLPQRLRPFCSHAFASHSFESGNKIVCWVPPALFIHSVFPGPRINAQPHCVSEVMGDEHTLDTGVRRPVSR